MRSYARLAFLLVVLAVLGCASPTTFHALSSGDRVRYLASASAPPLAWTQVAFDDKDWQEGVMPVGARRAEKKDEEEKGTLRLYVRAPFSLGAQAPLMTRLAVTDPTSGGPATVYINGVEVARDAVGKLAVEVPPGTLRPSGNVVAIMAGAGVHTVDFQLDVAPPTGKVGIVRGPYLQRLSPSGVTVVFDTAESVPGRVVVDASDFDGPAATHHEIRVEGLHPSSAYAYHVEAGDARSEVLELVTAPRSGEPVRFLVYGDTRTNGDNQRRLVRAMVDEGVDIALNTGDLVDSGADADEWDTFFALEYPLLARTALLPVLGNHETDGVDAFRSAFVLPEESPFPERTYSLDVGDVHFIALDSNLPLNRQTEFLETDLVNARQHGARHVFVFLHHGPYSAGSGHGGSSAAQRFIAPILRTLGVDAMFSGHDHIYERGQAFGLRYFVSGGGGAPLHDVTPLATTEKAESRLHYLLVTCQAGHVRVEAKDPDGQIFDTAAW